MTSVNIDPKTQVINVESGINKDVIVLARTQEIIVDPSTQAVSVVNAGPQGPPGGGAGASAYYKHSQNVPSTTWTVDHNLGVRTSVAIYDSADDEVESDIRWLNDDNTTVITFAYGITGIAVFS